jgi:hypothetical protein
MEDPIETWDRGVGIYISREYTNCGQYGFLDRDCTLILVKGVALGGGGGEELLQYIQFSEIFICGKGCSEEV